MQAVTVLPSSSIWWVKNWIISVGWFHPTNGNFKPTKTWNFTTSDLFLDHVHSWAVQMKWRGNGWRTPWGVYARFLSPTPIVLRDLDLDQVFTFSTICPTLICRWRCSSFHFLTFRSSIIETIRRPLLRELPLIKMPKPQGEAKTMGTEDTGHIQI